MKSVREFFGLTDKSRQDQAVLRAEAKEFKTPGELLPQILKYIFFLGLAFLNFRLFYKTVPGLYGVAIGSLAILGEILAVYAIHNFSRSSGMHRIALGIGGGALCVFALTHSAFSFFDIVGDVPFMNTVHIYARQYAFPILFGLIGLMAIALKMTHPKNQIRLAQAKAHSDILIDRAKAASELELLHSRSTIERANLDRLNEKIALDTEYLASLRQTIDNEQAKIEMVANIPEKPLREKIARDLGLDLAQLDRPNQAQPNQTQPNQPQYPRGAVYRGNQRIDDEEIRGSRPN